MFQKSTDSYFLTLPSQQLQSIAISFNEQDVINYGSMMLVQGTCCFKPCRFVETKTYFEIKYFKPSDSKLCKTIYGNIIPPRYPSSSQAEKSYTSDHDNLCTSDIHPRVYGENEKHFERLMRIGIN